MRVPREGHAEVLRAQLMTMRQIQDGENLFVSGK